MFTGLVKEIGKVVRIQKNAEGVLLELACSELLSEIAIDDSVSINGACQTAVEVNEDSFVVQTVHTSLQKTTLVSSPPLLCVFLFRHCLSIVILKQDRKSTL